MISSITVQEIDGRTQLSITYNGLKKVIGTNDAKEITRIHAFAADLSSKTFSLIDEMNNMP